MDDKTAAFLRTAPQKVRNTLSEERDGRSSANSFHDDEAPVSSPMRVKVDRPIFVVGVGRSGSTIFHDMFSQHPQVTWLSALCDRFPSRPGFNRALMRMMDWPLLAHMLRRRYEPAECYEFWNYHCRGFSQPCRDMLAFDVTVANRRRIPRAMARLPVGRRQRLLFKITGWPRIGFLHALFPDARFIHVYRDGRAVANSLLAVDFWRGWHGPGLWRWGELAAEYQAEWERHDKSFVALAGIQWKLLMEATRQAAARIPPAQFLEVRYEDFVTDPVARFREVLQFCELDWSPRFERAIASYTLETANSKWREDLTPEQQEILQSVLAESLRKYGYA